MPIPAIISLILEVTRLVRVVIDLAKLSGHLLDLLPRLWARLRKLTRQRRLSRRDEE
jgi:hypothetical protein